ncbi:MAG: type II toxin-antitoxin system ParD family antitoxin [Rhodospirillaceae bacterium]|nr:type II toxin-antitoxin system ParD family antitoxin [Rhodospirillaceae bacterium]
MNISLGTTFEDFVDQLVKSGRFVSASEVMRAGLRLLMEQEEQSQAKLTLLRAEIQKGIDQADRGEFVDLDLDDVLAEADGPRRRTARG